jgi:apolipoprotein D and lipocalin family protein
MLFFMLTMFAVLDPSVPPAVAPSVDLARYAGTWYEIASFPMKFQKACTNTTATYTLRDDGNVNVYNRCDKEGNVSSITGKAYAVPGSSNAKLKVQFFWILKGDYWVLYLDPDYRFVLVGNPKRSSLWILSRTPQLPEGDYLKLIAEAKARGFDTTKLVKTPQKG